MSIVLLVGVFINSAPVTQLTILIITGLSVFINIDCGNSTISTFAINGVGA
jgi:hypothetical protein